MDHPPPITQWTDLTPPQQRAIITNLITLALYPSLLTTYSFIFIDIPLETLLSAVLRFNLIQALILCVHIILALYRKKQAWYLTTTMAIGLLGTYTLVLYTGLTHPLQISSILLVAIGITTSALMLTFNLKALTSTHTQSPRTT